MSSRTASPSWNTTDFTGIGLTVQARIQRISDPRLHPVFFSTQSASVPLGEGDITLVFSKILPGAFKSTDFT